MNSQPAWNPRCCHSSSLSLHVSSDAGAEPPAHGAVADGRRGEEGAAADGHSRAFTRNAPWPSCFEVNLRQAVYYGLVESSYLYRTGY